MFLGFGFCGFKKKKKKDYFVGVFWGGRVFLGFLFGAILAECVQNGSLAQRKAPASSLGRDRRELPWLLSSGGIARSQPASSSPGPPTGAAGLSFICTRENNPRRRAARRDGEGRRGSGHGAAPAPALRTFRAHPRAGRPRCPLPPRVTPAPGKAGGPAGRTSEEPGHQAGPELFNVIAQERVRCLPLFYVPHV